MEQSFSDLHVHGNLLDIVLKSSTWISLPEMGSKMGLESVLLPAAAALLCVARNREFGLL